VGGKIIYDINFLLVWRGKVLAQMVESTLIVWEDLGLSPKYAIYVIFNYHCFNNLIVHVN